MIKKTANLPNQSQQNLFDPLLKTFIDPKHELVLLADKMDWSYFEKAFEKHYSHLGQKGMPIRAMVSFLLLKRLYNLGDETLAKAWVMNPYFQYFSGYAHFCHSFPCDPSDLVHFRKRIGEKGIETIFAYSVKLHGKDAQGRMVLSDTTVQENNTTFPTDAKLAKAVIDKCNGIAAQEGITQRQSYKRTSKQLLRDTHNSKHPRRAKKARKAGSKLRTLAMRQVRELRRKLTAKALAFYKPLLDLCERAATQKRKDKNKVYSLHKDFTACIAKGKASRQYEFGNKVGLIVESKSLVITAISAFEGNPNDSKTIEPLLKQHKDNTAQEPQEVVYDRGGKGPKQIGKTKILTPVKPLKRDTVSKRRTKRRKFRRRAAIEPVIGHLKSDFRMAQNYLWGKASPKINAMLAATGWNLKKMMQKLKAELLWLFFNRTFWLIQLNIKTQKQHS